MGSGIDAENRLTGTHEGETLMGVSIRGTVKDEHGSPLGDVKVLAVHEPTGSVFAKITKEDGEYLFDNIKVGGPYALTASREGLEPVEDRLHLKTEEELFYDFTMHQKSEQTVDGELQPWA